MSSKIIEISGAGPHEIIAGTPGKRIIVEYMFLTFSHQEAKAQMVRIMSGSDVIITTYALDGGEIEYARRDDDTTRVGLGEPFKVEMTEGLSAAGRVEYTVGAQ